MDSFRQSCFLASQYPKNLPHSGVEEYHLRKYYEILNENSQRLFSPPEDARVEFWQFEENAKGFTDGVAENDEQMKSMLRIIERKGRKDPMCRFIFFRANHSRDPLNTTRDMFTSALTYHQVMPAFVDFVLPFGDQEYPTDFYFSGFRHENSLSDQLRKPELHELGRSGTKFQLCYSLKSVEPTEDERLPWSIRQTAVHHSFDVETGRTAWITIKGNALMRNRIKKVTQSEERPVLRSYSSPSEAFNASLATHLIVCEWAGENWRWYINFLEKELRSKTGDALHAPVSRPSTPDNKPPPRRESAPQMRPNRAFSNLSGASQIISRVLSFRPNPDPNPQRNPPSLLDTAVPNPTVTTNTQAPIPDPPPSPETLEEPTFSFHDLQHTQHIEEKANDASLVLKMNANILCEIKHYYASLTSSSDFPGELHRGCQRSVDSFIARISAVIHDLEMQQSRLQALLKLLSDRKTLLYAILDYRNILMGGRLARRSQVSADRMEKITDQMRKIAKKTEKETVSMRIITLVTLIFLPGTFISTLLSTDIIRFPFSNSTGQPQRQFSRQALGLYLSITLPLMAFTFLVAWLCWRCYKFRDREKLRDEESEGDYTVKGDEGVESNEKA